MTPTKLHAKLLCIQADLKAPKSQYNDYGGYYYRKAEDILEAVKPLLKKYGCTLVCQDELVQVGDRYYIKAMATLTDIEDPTQSLTAQAFAREEETKKGMDGSQITGASSSYARKYALNGLLCIDDTQDSETTNKGDGTPKKAPAPKKAASTPKPKTYAGGLSEAQYGTLVSATAKGLSTKNGENPREAFIKHCNPTPVEIEEFDAAVARLEMKLNK
jgi:hypothetical protein